MEQKPDNLTTFYEDVSEHQVVVIDDEIKRCEESRSVITDGKCIFQIQNPDESNSDKIDKACYGEEKSGFMNEQNIVKILSSDGDKKRKDEACCEEDRLENYLDKTTTYDECNNEEIQLYGKFKPRHEIKIPCEPCNKEVGLNVYGKLGDEVENNVGLECDDYEMKNCEECNVDDFVSENNSMPNEIKHQENKVDENKSSKGSSCPNITNCSTVDLQNVDEFNNVEMKQCDEVHNDQIEDLCNKGINYADAICYWNDIPATVDGMLGGFGFISSIDIQGSDQFLKSLFQMKNCPDKIRALDCGAGIGRVTKHLLANFFKKVDLVEPVKSFIDESKNYIKNDEKVGELFNVGLQDFKPCTKYDVIWCQWVLSHLTNSDLVNFFNLCRESLKANGIIVVKENLASSEEGDLDRTDSSRTRNESELKQLFISGGLRIMKENVQKRFPKGLYRVKMYALRPQAFVNVT